VLFFGLDVRLVKGGQVMDSLAQGIQKLWRGSLISFLQLGLSDLKSFKLDLSNCWVNSRIAASPRVRTASIIWPVRSLTGPDSPAARCMIRLISGWLKSLRRTGRIGSFLT
jgi:hypothetical protein